jgi:hypothetical protein
VSRPAAAAHCPDEPGQPAAAAAGSRALPHRARTCPCRPASPAAAAAATPGSSAVGVAAAERGSGLLAWDKAQGEAAPLARLRSALRSATWAEERTSGQALPVAGWGL